MNLNSFSCLLVYRVFSFPLFIATISCFEAMVSPYQHLLLWASGRAYSMHLKLEHYEHYDFLITFFAMASFKQYINCTSLIFQCTADLGFQIAGDMGLFMVIHSLYGANHQVALTVWRMIAVQCVLVFVLRISIL